jgi:plasmid maintenance system antidote protein VapI
MNLTLKAALIERFGSQMRAAKVMKISPTYLSYLVNGHRDASDDDLAALSKVFGAEKARSLLHTEQRRMLSAD